MKFYHYHQKRYYNPFRRQRKIRKPKIQWSKSKKRILIEVSLFAICVIWFFFLSGIFDIKNIQINGLKRISEDEIRNLIQKKIQKNSFLNFKKNLIFFNQDKLFQELNEYYSFEDTLIRKQFPDTLILDICERVYAYVWYEDELYYYADLNNYIIHEVNIESIDREQFPIIYNKSDQKLNNYKINVSTDYTNYIFDLAEYLKNYNFPVDRFIIDNDVNTVKAVIRNGPEIYFNIHDAMETQINKLIITRKEKIKDDFLEQKYIDLRYGDKIFFR